MSVLKRLIMVALFSPLPLFANDFPTIDRVDYVLRCMEAEGGQSVETLFQCSCRLDVIAQHVSFDEYDAANTFARFKKMPGEKGGLFRDNAYGEELEKKLEQAEVDAEKRCFIGVRRSESAEP